MKHSNFTNHLITGVLAAAGMIISATVANAAIYHVEIDTAALNLSSNSANGPFSLDVQLNDGHGTGDGNNSVTLSNFTFGGGSLISGATLLGGASGDLGSTVSLTDSSAFNEFFQAFNAGTSLGFDVSLTGNPDAGLTPDAFAVAILDNNLLNIPTTSPFADDSLVRQDIGGAVTFSSGTGSYAGVVAAVPEPGFDLGGLALLTVCGSHYFGRRRSRAAVAV